MSRLIGRAFGLYDAESFHSFVKSLIKSNNPNQSKEVMGVSLSQLKGKTTIRLTRDSKTLTRDELTKLSEEYKLTEQELLVLFKKRKIGIMYDISDTRIESDKAAIEAHAGNKKTRKRKVSDRDELQQLGDNPRMFEENSI